MGRLFVYTTTPSLLKWRYMKVRSLEELEKVAKEFLASLSGGDRATVVALEGNLGAGKTTFTQVCAKLLGIQDTVTSPTFVILKRYDISHPLFSNLVHVDAYRLESGKELEDLDFKEVLDDPKNLVFLEWPERVREILPDDILRVRLEFVDEHTRDISFDD